MTGFEPVTSRSRFEVTHTYTALYYLHTDEKRRQEYF